LLLKKLCIEEHDGGVVEIVERFLEEALEVVEVDVVVVVDVVEVALEMACEAFEAFEGFEVALDTVVCQVETVEVP
jgi:hypothetical protein